MSQTPTKWTTLEGRGTGAPGPDLAAGPAVCAGAALPAAGATGGPQNVSRWLAARSSRALPARMR